MPYGCHSRPRPTAKTSYVAQSGWNLIRDGKGRPINVPVHVDIKHTMSTDCRFDKRETDKQCAGCPHIGNGKE